METVRDFIWGGSKITAYGDCSHEIKRSLLLGRKAMTNLDSILKSRHYFTNKALSSQSYGFSSSYVWMWELHSIERWLPNNWCFWTMVLKKTLESLLDCKEINQSILKEISPEYSLEGLMLKLKPQYFGTWCEELTHWKILWCWERLKAGGEGEDRGWDGWMALPMWWTWVWIGYGSWWWTGKPGMLQSIGSQRIRHNWVTELNWISGIW